MSFAATIVMHNKYFLNACRPTSVLEVTEINKFVLYTKENSGVVRPSGARGPNVLYVT